MHLLRNIEVKYKVKFRLSHKNVRHRHTQNLIGFNSNQAKIFLVGPLVKDNLIGTISA